MDVFISWSEERSRIMAEALRGWLPKVINDVQPWLSSEDIDPGARWNSEMVGKLGSTEYGIICLTPENVDKPWILFEAGALSKSVNTSRVVPYLHELKPTDLKGPLTQFQAIEANEEDTRRLVEWINSTVESSKGVSIEHEALIEAYSVWWPKLEEKLSGIPDSPSPSKPQRKERDILEEILSIVRSEARETKVGTPVVQRARRRHLSDSQRLSQLRAEKDYAQQKIDHAGDQDEYFMWTKNLISINEQINELEHPEPPEWLVQSEIIDPDE